MTKGTGSGNRRPEAVALTAEEQEEKEKQALEVRTKILHLLSIYPIISPTMLQGGLGAYIKPAVWRPILHELIQEGEVIEEKESLETPQGRYNSYTKLRLPGVEVEFNYGDADIEGE